MSRKLVKEYMEAKIKELKNTYKSNAELASRIGELMKIVKINEVNLNVDGLTATKVDAKCCCIILSEAHIIEKIEIFPDKSDPKNVEKQYQLSLRKSGKKDD